MILIKAVLWKKNEIVVVNELEELKTSWPMGYVGQFSVNSNAQQEEVTYGNGCLLRFEKEALQFIKKFFKIIEDALSGKLLG